VQTDVNKDWLSTLAACRLFQHPGSSRHQRVDSVPEVDRVAYITASVPATALNGTNGGVNVVKNYYRYGTYTNVFDKSAWQESTAK